MLLGVGCLSMWLVGILGYATSPELNTFSALIQNCYTSTSDGAFPHPAVHLTMSTAPVGTWLLGLIYRPLSVFIQIALPTAVYSFRFRRKLSLPMLKGADWS